MNWRLVWWIGGALLALQCGVALCQEVKENLKVQLTDSWVQLVGEDSMASFPLGDSSIVDREPFPIYMAPVIAPAGRAPREYTPIVVGAHVTKRGNVRRAWIISSGSPYFNKAVLKSVVQWKYSPRIVNHLPQDTVMTIEVPLPREH